MRRLLGLLAAAVLLTAAGCGGDGDKGIYSNRDKPVAAPRDDTDRPAAGSPRGTEGARPPADSRRTSER